MTSEDTTANYQRFYDAIDSMEKQLATLYEEKLQNSSLQDKVVELEALLEKVRYEKLQMLEAEKNNKDSSNEIDIDAIKDNLISIGFKLDDLCSDSHREIDGEFLVQCNSLKSALDTLNSKIHGSSSEVVAPLSEGSNVLEKKTVELLKANTELANKNLELQKMLDEAKTSIDALRDSSEQEIISIKQGLNEELRSSRTELSDLRNELAQTKLRYKEIGTIFIEKFFGE